MSDPNRVSIREAARRLGVAHPVIVRQCRRWQLRGAADGKIDFAELVRLRGEALQPGQALRQVVERAEPTLSTAHDGVDAPPGASLAAAAEHKRLQADLLRLELAERRARLVDRAEVAEALETASRAARDALLALPARAASEIVGMTDLAEVRAVVSRHVQQTLAELVGRLETVAAGDAEALVETFVSALDDQPATSTTG